MRVVSGSSITTLRDVKRLASTYHAFCGMLQGEADWIDLLAYSVLIVKLPAIVDAIRHDPGRSSAMRSRRATSIGGSDRSRQTPEKKLEALLAGSEFDTPEIGRSWRSCSPGRRRRRIRAMR